MTAQPKPERMTRDREIDLIARAKLGDRNALSQVLSAHARLISACARAYGRRSSVSSDDLEQVGALALIRAVETFDASYGTRLCTHALPWIRYRMRQWFAGEVRNSRIDVDGAHSDECATPESILIGSDEARSWSAKLRDALAALSRRERSVVLARYVDGLTRDRVAVEILGGVSGARASQIEKRALDKMKRAMHAKGIGHAL